MRMIDHSSTANGTGDIHAAMFVEDNTEMNIHEGSMPGEDVLRIGELTIFLSRDDLECLADCIATYTGGEFITEKAVRNRA